MATSSVAYNKPVLPRVSDTSDLASNRASVYSGKGLDFDGVNDSVSIPSSVTSVNITGNQLSIAGWFIHDGSAYWQSIMYKDTGNNVGYQVFVDASSYFEFGIHAGGVFSRFASSQTVKTNTWYFFACTYDGASMKIYLNGALDTSISKTGNITSAASYPLYIGRNYGGSELFNGRMSGIRIWDTGLTATQVAELYNNPEQILPTGVNAVNLKLWLPMMEGAGSYVYNGAAGALGTELVSNGGFDEVCQKWGLSDVATIAITGGKAVWTNPASGGAFADQYISATTGKTYRVTFDYSASDSGFVYVGDQYVSIPSGNGTFTADITYTSGNARVRFAYGSSSALTASIDNVSVKEVVPQATGTISGATWVAGLPEPLPQTALMDWNKSTNRSEYSEDLTQTAWTKNGVTATAASVVSPLGTTGGVFNVVPSTANAIHLIQDGSYSVGNGSYYVASAWFKANGYRYAFLSFSGYGNWTGGNGAEVLFDLYNGTASPTGGAPYDYGIEAYADGWYKCYTIAQATTSFSTNVNFFVSNGTTSTSFTGDGTSGLYMFGLQSQIATTVGTYVPTYASAQTSPVLIPKGLTTGKDIFGNSIAVPRSSGAFNFDGASYVKGLTLGVMPTGNAARTLEVWVYYKPNGAAQSLIEIGSGVGSNQRFGLLANPTNTGSVYIVGQSNDNQFANILIPSNEWTHLTVTHDGTTLKVYKNGALAGSAAETYATIDTGYTIGIEQRTSTPSSISGAYEWAQSQVSTPRIYNFALTAEQVADNYNQKATTVGATKTDSELQAYINRTVSAGATVEDHANLLNTLTELDNKSGCL